MDVLWLLIAFGLGFVARQAGLPPLVGFLAAGFALGAMGAEGGSALGAVSDLGITLLLFTIGLKLRIATLARPEVWAVATLHMGLTTALFYGGLVVAGLWLTPVAAASPLALLVVAFALSFSSTVFAVKIMEDRGDTDALHGRVAIGILIMQDLFAVAYLAVNAGRTPSLYALGLLALPLARPLLGFLLARCGHGELLVLFGLATAIGGAELFEAVGVKGDLGALLLGVLLAPHRQASELAKSLFAFKELFLIGFFLSIGLAGTPGTDALVIAGLLLLIGWLKLLPLHGLLVAFKLRARTAALATLALATHSEFGLIVGAIALRGGLLDETWITGLAIAVAASFALASPPNVFCHQLYARFDPWLRRVQRRRRLPGDEPIDPGDAGILVCGMGRVGTAAYDEIRRRYGETVVGVDVDERATRDHLSAGRNVIHADAKDPDFWDKAKFDRLGLVLLSMPNHAENLYTARQLARQGFRGVITATAQFPDEVAELEAAGVSGAYNLRSEAGLGFANLTSECYEGLKGAVGAAD